MVSYITNFVNKGTNFISGVINPENQRIYSDDPPLTQYLKAAGNNGYFRQGRDAHDCFYLSPIIACENDPNLKKIMDNDVKDDGNGGYKITFPGDPSKKEYHINARELVSPDNDHKYVYGNRKVTALEMAAKQYMGAYNLNNQEKTESMKSINDRIKDKKITSDGKGGYNVTFTDEYSTIDKNTNKTDKHVPYKPEYNITKSILNDYKKYITYPAGMSDENIASEIAVSSYVDDLNHKNLGLPVGSVECGGSPFGAMHLLVNKDGKYINNDDNTVSHPDKKEFRIAQFKEFRKNKVKEELENLNKNGYLASEGNGKIALMGSSNLDIEHDTIPTSNTRKEVEIKNKIFPPYKFSREHRHVYAITQIKDGKVTVVNPETSESGQVLTLEEAGDFFSSLYETSPD